MQKYLLSLGLYSSQILWSHILQFLRNNVGGKITFPSLKQDSKYDEVFYPTESFIKNINFTTQTDLGVYSTKKY